MSNIKIQSFDGSVYTQLLPQNSASLTTYSNTKTSISATNVQDAIDSCFTSVSNGKSLIASAITDMGVSTGASDSFSTMAENIRKLKHYEIVFGPFLNALNTSYAGIIETNFSSGQGTIWAFRTVWINDRNTNGLFKNQYIHGSLSETLNTAKIANTLYMFENSSRNVEISLYSGTSNYSKHLYCCFMKIFD